MKAMILAAGEGSRLRPFTEQSPKVLAPVNGVPLLQHMIGWLRLYGITEIAVNLHYLGEKIRDFLGDGTRFDVKVTYSREAKLLGTAGGVKKMEHFFSDSFVVIYGDIFTNINLASMIDFHQRNGGIVTVAAQIETDPRAKGVITVDGESRITRFTEKPDTVEPGSLANAGIYMFETEILSYIKPGAACDFGYDVFPRLLSSGQPVYAYIIPDDEYLVDIGSWEQYHQVEDDVKKGMVKVLR